jgi:DNA-binding NtrC family response regulator
VDVRILSATNANLTEEIATSRFRQNLLYRLKTVEIRVPPLRERKEDIPLLATHFLQRHASQYRKYLAGFDPMSLQILLSYPAGGKSANRSHGRAGPADAQGQPVRPSDLGLEPKFESGPRLEEMTIDQAEEVLIQNALSRFQGDVSKAAEALGISRGSLYRRLEKHGIG